MTKRLPLAFLAILLIVLLAGLGVAYGLWSETLTIEGTVNTGNVDVQFADVSIEEKVYDYNVRQEISEPQAKANAANCTYQITGTGTDNETLVITAQGAYPSWRCYVHFSVESIGSVPVHVFRPERQSVSPSDDDLPEAFWCDFSTSQSGTTAMLEGATPQWGWPTPPPPQYKQLHQGEKLICHIKIHFDNNEGIGENSTYKFKYTILAKQWNE